MEKVRKLSRRRFLLSLGAAALGVAGFLATYRLTSPLSKNTVQTKGDTTTIPQTGNVKFRVETFLDNLTIPWSLAFTPDDRMFFTERVGRISTVEPGSSEPRLFANVPVEDVGEGGLLGLAISPAFASDSFVYVYHTYREGSNLLNRVVRYKDQDGAGTELRVIIDKIPGAGVHDGGRIRFGPDGKLYIGTGESGKGQLAQNLQSFGGKVLRVNPDGSFPEDNPFPNSPVYCYGNRNVQGLAWHPLNNKMYETEHGPTGEKGWSANDEVNLIEPGKNYGWPDVICKANDPRFVDPVYCTGNNETWAPSGCSFYKSEKSKAGNLFPEWENSLFIATLRGTHLHRFLFNPQTGAIEISEKLLEGTFGRLRDVAQGPDGLLYILTNNRDGRGLPASNDDRILRIVPEQKS